jgi:serine phosphatase RsbU (regulator of sigma subunit)
MGVFLNGRAIAQPTLLSDGDRITLGQTNLSFQAEADMVVFSEAPLKEGPGIVVLPGGRSSSFEGGLRMTEDFTAKRAPGPGTRPWEPSTTGSPWEILAEADERLLAHRPLQEILEGILDLAGRAVPFERAALVLRQEDRWEPAVVRTPPGQPKGAIPISRTVADRVLNQGEAVLTTDALEDERFRDGQSIVLEQIRSAMCVPLWNRREVIGLVYVDSRRDSSLFTEENLRLLAHLAQIAAIKIENCRLFEKSLEAQAVEREIRLAAEIQRHLLPAEAPQILGESIPCHAVGGDYYGYLQLPGERFGLAVGDVSGKGFPASLLMCSFQASLMALAEMDLPPKEIFLRLNRTLARRFPDGRFVTLFYGVLDPRLHRMTYANAGHCPPYLLSPGREPRALLQTGRPLGLFEEGGYEGGEVAFGEGDSLLCYTDGILGVRGAGAECFDTHRLLGLCGATDPGPAKLVGRILTEAEILEKGRPREDDLTLVILRRSP